MRAAVCDPYLDTLGGGERYMMIVASVLHRAGFRVDVPWVDPLIKDKIKERLGVDLTDVNIVHDVGRGSGYDVVFWLSDGSVPFLLGKKNILHFQTPFAGVGGRSFFNRVKFLKIDSVVCNSKFTKGFIDREYGVKSSVVYPPVATKKFKPLPKQNLIVSVGRFSKLQQEKRQEVLVGAFKKLVEGGLEDWKLVLVGGSDVGGREFVEELRREAEGFPIEIHENMPFREIKSIYGKAKIFWSASGYGVDEQKEPQKTEHFGITVVEAMAAGCVPIVVGKGGYTGIVKNGKNGFLWSSTEELVDLTRRLIEKERRLSQVAKKAQRRSERFSEERFEKEILKIIS